MNQIGFPYHLFWGNDGEVYVSGRSSIQDIWYFVFRFIILVNIPPLEEYAVEHHGSMKCILK
jgi:hypothetical protein